MLANQVIYKVINDMKEITDTDCSVWGLNANCIAYTGKSCLNVQPMVQEFLEDAGPGGFRLTAHASCFMVCYDDDPVYVLVLHEGGKFAEKTGLLLVSQFDNLMKAYQKRMDKNHFYQNLLLDNMLLVDILNQAKKLGIENEHRRVVFLIEAVNENDNLVLEMLKGIYSTGTKDAVTSVDEHHVIYVKSLENTDDYQSLRRVAQSLVTTMNTEAMVSVRVAYGTVAEQLKDVSKSYKEAAMALDVGRVFYEAENVLAYNELGIGRLIHQLPTSLCEMFLEEVFEGKAYDQFDDETISTVNQFFIHNLNISETARHLYIHRNTLVYRLERIHNTTGLDVRVFQDALTFKIAMMVSQHMKSMSEQEFE